MRENRVVTFGLKAALVVKEITISFSMTWNLTCHVHA